jgi:hypothetical protein
MDTNDIDDDADSSSSSNWYEGGVFVASLSSRFGSMMGIWLASCLLRYDISWRTIVYIAAYSIAMACSIIGIYISDAPHSQNEPQNPIDPTLIHKWFPAQVLRRKRWSINRILRLLIFIVQTNVVPSVRHIVGSGTFWIVTMSHTGNSMVRTAQRFLGSYFVMTSDGIVLHLVQYRYRPWFTHCRYDLHQRMSK